MLAGEQKTAGYEAIHPLGRVPTLDDDGVVVWESGAILLLGFQMFRRAPEKRDQQVRQRMPEVLHVLDRQLDGKDYVVGAFSIADCASLA